MIRCTILLFAGLLTLAVSTARAAPPAAASHPAATPLEHLPALKGDYFPLTDPGSGRVHHVYVRYPEGYDARSATRYPVVYVLDGDSLFPLLAPTHLFLHYDERLPEAIIVGIAYGGFDPAINKRHVDFTAPGSDTAAEQGGAPGFLAFLRAQLVPEVERRYAADPTRRVLVGQSRAGYFVLWSALQDPDLFWGRIASNPSPGPARDALFVAARPHTRTDLRVAVASGTRDTAERQRIARDWTTHWSAASMDAPWQVTLLMLQDGTHAATIGETYRRAMLWLFREDIPTP
ncbi:esterase family protein [Pseudoxanthomonas sp. LH2527]|uniref:alpha/beta hydrolase n=1 Tax=Pseudoxanthomonas sp. LH2527 TaxID=2923249 RepID=UPI001F13E9E1|nr:alpha/beta hydrolase-fold protein [Pseudoxanthomonas sp. LH2527]MCH6484566.1 esterase family protein [Pseudoxanthomonas sp. LH2527]